MNPQGNSEVFDLAKLESYFEENPGEYFLDFLKIRHLEAGIIKLDPGEEDTQTAHAEDELYFVISGSGMLQLGKKSIAISRGKIIFVPPGLDHRFYGNQEVLTVLYVFAKE